MARREHTNLKHEFMYGRWSIFGEWITHQRLLVGFTQQQAANAVGVSRRQWIRYELGAKVPVKRMERMSLMLHINPDKMLDRAGYRASFKRNAAREQLGRIHDLLCAGRLEFAMLQLLKLNDRITGIKAVNGPRSGGLEATDYSNAVRLLNRLPRSWVESLQRVMQERIKDKPDENKPHLSGKSLIRAKRNNDLPWA